MPLTGIFDLYLQICLIYCFSFFLVIPTFFDIAFCISKCFNCFNSLYTPCLHLIWSLKVEVSNVAIVKQCILQKVFLNNVTILLSLPIHSNFASVLSHYIATYDINSFLLRYLNFHVFSTFIAND